MKACILIYGFIVIATLVSCGPVKYVSAPTNTVPLRKNLEKDVYGSYVTMHTLDSLVYQGELIGIRNDTIVILSDSIHTVMCDFVSDARVIVHMPNNYKGGGIALIGLSSLVAVHAGQYGGSPLALGVFGAAFNGIGLASAQETENKMINYFDWSEGWEKVMRYSRFPKGIPAVIKFEELKPREKSQK